MENLPALAIFALLILLVASWVKIRNLQYRLNLSNKEKADYYLKWVSCQSKEIRVRNTDR